MENEKQEPQKNDPRNATLLQRIAALEEEVAELKRQVFRLTHTNAPQLPGGHIVQLETRSAQEAK